MTSQQQFYNDYFYFKVPNCSTTQRTIYKKINEIFNETRSPGLLLERADPCSTISYYDLVFKYQHGKYLWNCARVSSQNQTTKKIIIITNNLTVFCSKIELILTILSVLFLFSKRHGMIMMTFLTGLNETRTRYLMLTRQALFHLSHWTT